MLYHVSPLRNRESILARGLLSRAPERNFDCGDLIYLTTSISHAQRWAAEIVRQTGEINFALFEISDLDVPYVITENTEIGTPQVAVRTDIPTSKIKQVDTLLNIDPLPNLNRLFTPATSGYVFCAECERNLKDSPAVLEDHLWNYHEELANG